jgi:hypothetical protein
MTAAELNQLAAQKAEETSLYNGLTEQARLTGLTHGWSLPEYTAREARQRAAEKEQP